MPYTVLTIDEPSPPALGPEGEEFLAQLTDAAYLVALKHGVRGSSIELQLSIWNALRRVVGLNREESFCPLTPFTA